MIPLQAGRREETGAGVEELLRQAAAFQPDEPPPARAAAAALARWQERRACAARRRQTGLALGFVAGAALILAFFPRDRAGPEFLVSAPAPSESRAAAFRPPAGPKALLVADSAPVEPPAAVSVVAAPARTAVRPRSKRPAARSGVPTVRWEVETVDYDVSHVMAPGLLVRDGGEGEEYEVTPGIIEIVAPVETVSACEGPAEPPVEESLPEPVEESTD
jgi:hypothetical protein